MSRIAAVHNFISLIIWQSLQISQQIWNWDLFLQSEEQFGSPWRPCCPYQPISQHSMSTNASFSFYLRPCQHQHRCTSSLLSPFMFSVHMGVPPPVCPAFLPPSMKDTCSRLRPSEVRPSGKEFSSSKCSFLESALSSPCCPTQAWPVRLVQMHLSADTFQEVD